ncbi:MAG: hypothetical protein QOF70_2200 [Acetobacteraceae bacterium]|nr:hypothetical protein [Acetobacteraceae bacterium]
MAIRDELVVALAGRYTSSNRKERDRILDEVAAVSGLHRKHAMRLLRAAQSARRSGPRPARRLYNDADRDALIVTWDASDRVCGKRPLLPILVRGDGAARPSSARAGGLRGFAGDECRNDRSGAA